MPRTGQAVERPVAAQVPALAPTPATTITADDIAVPRIYIAQYMSSAVQEQRVKFGDVFLAYGADDSDPEVLWSLGSDDPGVLVHLLHLRKGKSYSPAPGAPLERFEFDDPDAPKEAWTTYDYTLVMPEIDPDLPARHLLTKSAKAVAQKVNLVIARNEATGPVWNLAFRLTSAKRENDKGKWAISQLAQVPADHVDPANVRAAEVLFVQIAPGLAARDQYRAPTPTGDEPTI